LQESYALFHTLTFLAALLYSSAGHGGASAYLAILAVCSFPQMQMSSAALVMNLMVSACSFFFYSQNRLISWKLVRSFLFTSIPLAFAGGLIQIPRHIYDWLLILVLLFAAWRLWAVHTPDELPLKTPPRLAAPLCGALIGLVSGIIGIGGGIFLSPLLILMRWATPKQTAAISAFFIFLNSMSGLLGRMSRNAFHLPGNFASWALFAAMGGLIGSILGASRFPSRVVKRVLSMILMIATIKLFQGMFH
jgi:uncharacterized protein